MSLPKPKRNPASTDPETAWVVRYSAPAAPGAKRVQPRVYGRTEKECKDNLIASAR